MSKTTVKGAATDIAATLVEVGQAAVDAAQHMRETAASLNETFVAAKGVSESLRSIDVDLRATLGIDIKNS